MEKENSYSYWPYSQAEIPGVRLVHGDPAGEWMLAMNASGEVFLWPRKDYLPDSFGAIPFYFHSDKEKLLQALSLFILGYTEDPILIHQSGSRYKVPMSWFTGNLAQLCGVGKIVDAHVNNHMDLWQVAQGWAEKIRRSPGKCHE